MKMKKRMMRGGGSARKNGAKMMKRGGSASKNSAKMMKRGGKVKKDGFRRRCLGTDHFRCRHCAGIEREWSHH
jgi:hypothetical protein